MPDVDNLVIDKVFQIKSDDSINLPAPMITYEEALAEENEQPEDLESKHTIQEESLEEKEKEEEEDGDKIPERWYNAIVPLVTLVAISLLRMYYDGKITFIAPFN